jgi:CBS domain-containing protein
MQVREVMSREVLVASPDDTIEKAAALMAQVNCGSLPVGENDRLVGMITDRDIALRAVAKGNPPDHCTVREVMSTSVKYVYEDETTQDAADSMSGLQVRRLPVLNRQKRLVGIVSLGDLAVKSNSRAAGALKDISKPNGGATN